MNPTRIYFIRNANRSRILATLAVQRHDAQSIRFAWAVASSKEKSPSRAMGRKHALARLNLLGEAYVNNQIKEIHWIDAKFSGDRLILASIVEHKDLIKTLRSTLIENLTEQAYRSQHNNIFKDIYHIVDDYLDLFARLREDCVHGKF